MLFWATEIVVICYGSNWKNNVLCNSIIRSTNPSKKWARYLNRHFTREDLWVTSPWKMLAIFSCKSDLRDPLSLEQLKMSIQTTPSDSKAGRSAEWVTHFGKQFSHTHTLHMTWPYHTCGVCSREMKTCLFTRLVHDYIIFIHNSQKLKTILTSM